MATKSTEKKTSLEPSEVFCAVGLLMPTKDMKNLVKDQTGSKLLTWAATDGYAIANKGIDPLDDRFKKMFKECAKLNRETTDLKKRQRQKEWQIQTEELTLLRLRSSWQVRECNINNLTY